MSSKISVIVHVTTDVEQLRNLILEHVIMFPPPYKDTILQIVQPFSAPRGRQIDVIISHGTRDVSIVDQNIRHHVMRTAILSFQNHRIRDLPTSPFPLSQSFDRRRYNHFASARIGTNRFAHHGAQRHATGGKSTNQECSICFETIMEADMNMLPCAHGFHEHCIGHWLVQNSSCPVCRHLLT